MKKNSYLNAPAHARRVHVQSYTKFIATLQTYRLLPPFLPISCEGCIHQYFFRQCSRPHLVQCFASQWTV